MELPKLFSTSSDQNTIFIGVLLTDISVQTFLIDIATGTPSILSQSRVFSFTDITQAVVKTDEALQELGPESEKINEVAFGFEDSWMVSGDLKNEKKPLLQKLSADLSLQPIGFVVLSESIIEQQLAHDTYYSGFIFSLGQCGLACSLLVKGQAVGTEHIGVSDSIQSDVAEALARFSQIVDEGQHFPQKLIITSLSYDKASLLEVEQQLLDFDWQSQPKFMQPPSISVLEHTEMVQNVLTQLTQAVASSKGMETTCLAVEQAVEQPKEALDTTEFGFTSVEVEREVPFETAEPEPDEVPTSFGIPISQPEVIGNVHVPKEESLSTVNSDIVFNAVSTDKRQPFFSSFFKKKHATAESMTYKKKTPLSIKQSVMIGIFAGIVTVVGGGYFYLLRTTVVTAHVTLQQKPVSKEVSITLDSSGAPSNPEELTLAADVVTKQISKNDFVQTSGTGLEGEKAKGVVSLFNKTTAIKKFGKGTKLKSGAIVFTLDEEVSIASASVTEKEVNGEKIIETKAGKVEVAITAEEIGAEANLEKDTALNIESFATSSYEANVSEGLSGGSSREYQTIAQEDRVIVLKNVTQLIQEEAKDLFKEDTGDGTYYIPVDEVAIISQEFNGEVGDEADILELTVTAEVSALAYNNNDLRPLANSVLGASIPEGFELGEKAPEILSLPKKASDSASEKSTHQILANISAVTNPIIDITSLYQEISSLDTEQAKKTLEEKESIVSVSFSYSPSFSQYFVSKVPNSQEKVVFNIE